MPSQLLEEHTALWKQKLNIVHPDAITVQPGNVSYPRTQQTMSNPGPSSLRSDTLATVQPSHKAITLMEEYITPVPVWMWKHHTTQTWNQAVWHQDRNSKWAFYPHNEDLRARTHTHVRTHARTHTHTHTYIYIHTISPQYVGNLAPPYGLIHICGLYYLGTTTSYISSMVS